MRRVREVIVVEGRYDRHAVSAAVDAAIIETSGFAVFSDNEKLNLVREMAEKRGIIVLTDSDSAGFLIRGHLKGMLPAGLIKHAYIPGLHGRERRKKAPSKEGLLGVEGMQPAIIIAALELAGATFEDEASAESTVSPLTKLDFYDLGLSGTANSAARRAVLLRRLGFPEKTSSRAFEDILGAIFSRQELEEYLREPE